MSSLPPVQPQLPPNTIVPIDEALFVPYLTNLYEDIANAVNSKDPNFYPMAISDVAQNILNVPTFGAFVICVSGVDTSLPTLVATLCKASQTAAGAINSIGAQVGTGAWAGNALTITSTATHFQIAHDRAGITGNFNIRLIGTQDL